MISNDAFEKAVTTTTQASPEAPAPVVETPAPKQAEPQVTPAAPEKPEQTEWDGDVNKLPPELQPWAKKAQRTLTKKAMADGEERRLGQEYKQFQSSSDWQAFQTWKQQSAQGGQPVPTAPQPDPALITQRDWEEAQLDSTGSKFNSLVDKMVNQKINQAAQIYGQELQQLRSTQQVTQFQQVLSDFADMNPDAVKLHEMGIMKPLLEDEMRSGKHKSYESMVHAAYERGSKMREAVYQDALAATQGRVQEKKNAVVNTGTSTAEADVAYVDKGSTFEQAFNFALQNKKVKVKAKQ